MIVSFFSVTSDGEDIVYRLILRRCSKDDYSHCGVGAFQSGVFWRRKSPDCFSLIRAIASYGGSCSFNPLAIGRGQVLRYLELLTDNMFLRFNVSNVIAFTRSSTLILSGNSTH